VTTWDGAHDYWSGWGNKPAATDEALCPNLPLHAGLWRHLFRKKQVTPSDWFYLWHDIHCSRVTVVKNAFT
jgi:hypothetical protein